MSDTPEQNGMSMPVSSRGLDDSRGQNSTAVEISISDRIRILAAQGLKPRDISSLLGVHPMIVIRVLSNGSA